MKTRDLLFLIGFSLIGFVLQAQNNPPVAQNDTIRTIPGYPVSVNVLLNDYDPDGDSIFIFPCELPYEDSIVYFESQYNQYFSIHDTIVRKYWVSDDTASWYNSFDTGYIYIILDNPYYDSLNINNVNARFTCFGNHFWDFPGGVGSKYFVPNGGTQTSIFSNTLWIGGMDINNNLHTAAEKYRQNGFDYWPGPVSNVYDSAYDVKWNRLWKLNKSDIEYHNTHWWETGYEPIEAILSWPGNGDVNNGQMEKIAPFSDANNDGIYEPMNGDYPVIKGDQALFFVFNDTRDIHTESGGTAFGFEIHGMAYAFDTPDDSALWNSTFLSYEIFNLSYTTYNETYIGAYTDLDLGYAYDDFIGCDVQNGFYYAYNGFPIDGNGEPEAYGENPPAQGVVILGGPYMDDDGIDNPKYDILGQQLCDESINGLNFGDTIIDNERFGMNRFMYLRGDPQIPINYYNYLKGIWTDNTHCYYGGNGHPSSGAVGPECNFLYPGDSDTCNWGTNGIPPGGGYNQPGNYWTEENEFNNPFDRRGLSSSGPFTFEPGDVHKLDLAFVWARAYDGNPWSSVLLLKERCGYIKEKFETEYDFFSDINTITSNTEDLILYPNPVAEKLTLKFPSEIKKGKITIYSMQGDVVYSQIINNKTEEQINTSSLLKGLYVIKVSEENAIYTIKFMKE